MLLDTVKKVNDHGWQYQNMQSSHLPLRAISFNEKAIVLLGSPYQE